VAAVQERFDGPWVNLGADVFSRHVVPARYRPGTGLRPGGERPDLEALVPVLYAAMYDSVAAHARHGLNVVVDAAHHEAFSRPLGVLVDAARRLSGLKVLFVGVLCPIEVVIQRRDAGQEGREGEYVQSGSYGEVPAPVRRWQEEVHRGKSYDLEVDTSLLSPAECADRIGVRLRQLPSPTAFERMSGLMGPAIPP
jgi:chloramphenicol 3-O phosphotransferase